MKELLGTPTVALRAHLLLLSVVARLIDSQHLCEVRHRLWQRDKKGVHERGKIRPPAIGRYDECSRSAGKRSAMQGEYVEQIVREFIGWRATAE